jgi:ribonucleoside-diphosphate reductase alpha chain
MFKDDSSEFVYVRTYSRWIEELGRRESWTETVDRFVNFIVKNRGEKIPNKVIKRIKEKLTSFEVMPSMRALWAAGPAAENDNTTMYNCSFQAIKDPIAFAESLYILMCGTGYGFDTRKVNIEQMPIVPTEIRVSDSVFIVEDSKAGWADSVKTLISNLYSGFDITMDYNKIRPSGARLKTMGGRASGAAPLVTLHSFIRDTFYKARGRKLTSIECHDIQCQVAEIVVVGGVRRSSEISLSDLNDDEMRHAKTGEFPVKRWMANNSAVYETKPNAVEFLKEWSALASSGTGERGIFNLEAARKGAPPRRRADLIEGTNPCGEIQLRNQQFCNLSEVVVRETDDLDSLLEKVETATWLGIIQSTFTHFPYLNPKWKENCDEERLLGISITGQMDAPHLLTDEALKALKSRAIKVAQKASKIMGINMPAAITCVKPSGTVSQLVNSASGLHPRFSKFYIRRYRISGNDPLFKMLKFQGVPLTPENGQSKKDWEKASVIYNETGLETKAKMLCPIFRADQKWSEDHVNTWVVSFPVKSPKTAVTVDQVNAIQQLEWYKKIQTNWCEHNASITVYVKDDEWFEVGNWVYKNWDIVNGVSFLPYDNHRYQQPPYEFITEEEYVELSKKVIKIDYGMLPLFEKEDGTEGAKSFACVAGVCEIGS